jgi:hypothetical protein
LCAGGIVAETDLCFLMKNRSKIADMKFRVNGFSPGPAIRVKFVMLRQYLVLIPTPTGGSHDFYVEAETSVEAAWEALVCHCLPVPDGAVITASICCCGPNRAAGAEAETPTLQYAVADLRERFGMVGE